MKFNEISSRNFISKFMLLKFPTSKMVFFTFGFAIKDEILISHIHYRYFKVYRRSSWTAPGGYRTEISMETFSQSFRETLWWNFMKFHLEISSPNSCFWNFVPQRCLFFFRKIGRENNMPKKWKEKNDQHLPKSSSYVSILSWYQINEMNSPPPPGPRAGEWWLVVWWWLDYWLVIGDGLVKG